MLIRHGATAWNAAGRLQGRADIGLSAAGRAAVARWRLPAALGRGALAGEPAAPGARDRGAAGRAGRSLVEPRLIEMDWGAWEGCSAAELRAAAAAELAAKEARGLDLRPPGGESPREVAARVSQLAPSSPPTRRRSSRSATRA